jgi:hypothetical protein
MIIQQVIEQILKVFDLSLHIKKDSIHFLKKQAFIERGEGPPGEEAPRGREV